MSDDSGTAPIAAPTLKPLLFPLAMDAAAPFCEGDSCTI